MTRPFRFAVYAYQTLARSNWEETARRTEALGYSTLVMPDHFVNSLTPTPALAFASAVTTTLRVGSIVFANDYRHPAVLAKEAAVMDLLSGGRFEFGIGAGWLQKEYDAVGIPFDPPGVRIDRMIEAINVIRGLWNDGPLEFTGKYYTIAGLEGQPKPLQNPHPPIFMGGTGKRMLEVAAREANIVGLLPKNLPQGGHDWAGSTFDVLQQQVAWVREAAGERFDDLELSYVAFRVIVIDRADVAIDRLSQEFKLTPEQLHASPDVLFGSTEQIVEQLLERRERFGISYIEIDEADSVDFAPVVAELAGK